MTAHLRHSSLACALATSLAFEASDEVNAGGGTRTRIPVRARDFKSPRQNGKQRQSAPYSGNSGTGQRHQDAVAASGESRTAQQRHSRHLSPSLIAAAVRRARGVRS